MFVFLMMEEFYFCYSSIYVNPCKYCISAVECIAGKKAIVNMC